MSKRKSVCNKSCRYLCKDSRTVEFAFFYFSTIFKRIYNFAVWNWKLKTRFADMPLTLAQNPLGSKNKSQPCPWMEVEEGQDRGSLSRPKSGGSGRRRRGESGGGARGDRALPVCGLKRGWGWPEVCSPWRAVGGGDGRPRRRRSGEGKR